MKRICLLLVLTAGLLSGCTKANINDIDFTDLEEIHMLLDEVELSDVQSTKGSHGDGYVFASAKWDNERGCREAEQQMAEDSKWKALPLSGNLQAAVYGSDDGETMRSPLAVDKQGELLFPNIQHGYYLFRDQHSDSDDEQDDSQLWDRDSFDFVLVVYDSDTQTMYFWQLDT